MNVISCMNTPSYDAQTLDRVVQAHFDRLDIASDLKPGMKVLLKPNLLLAADPKKSITTNPALVAAVVRWLTVQGVTDITLADSPGGVYTTARLRNVYTACGLTTLDGMLKLNEDVTYERVHAKGCRAFNIITPILQADYIINMPKLKTHGMTTMSGAIKNLFGCVPGLQKPELHCLNPNNETFAPVLVEVALTVKPQVTIVDAVEAMEGTGPSAGVICYPRLTAASRNIFLLDRFLADDVIRVGWENVPMLSYAAKKGLLDDPAPIEGEYDLPAKPFALPESVSVDFAGKFPKFMQPVVKWVLETLLIAMPSIVKKDCVGCAKCAESCPNHIIHMEEGKAVIDKKGCISCFCCQEMCPRKCIKTVRRVKL